MSNATLAIRNALMVDGTGAPAFKGDVAVEDGKILAVGSSKRRGERNRC